MTKYVVTAETGFDGHQLGEEFDADLDEELEERALERGQIEVVGKRTKKEASSDG